jgi:hypothetical protein
LIRYHLDGMGWTNGAMPSVLRAVPRPRQVIRRIAGRPVPVTWPPTVEATPSSPALDYPADTFGYRNDSRIRHRGKPDLHANWCIVIARAVTQFKRFARFDPAAPRVSPDLYTALVRRVVALPPWQAVPRDEMRIVVPGFGCLYDFTRSEERAVKAGLTGRLSTWIHPTNWRMALPSPPGEQERTALEIIDEVRAGRPAQLFITDFPKLRLNHSVLAYDYRVTSAGTIDFVVYDPNDAHAPGVMRFDRGIGRFIPAPLIGVDVPCFRAFRIHYSDSN